MPGRPGYGRRNPAHAQSPADLIEADQWQQDQIQRPDRALAPTVGQWLSDTEAVALEFFALLETLEHHARAWPGMQYRQVSALAPALGLAQQQARVDFTVVGQVQGDMPGAAEQGVLRQLAVQAA